MDQFAAWLRKLSSSRRPHLEVSVLRHLLLILLGIGGSVAWDKLVPAQAPCLSMLRLGCGRLYEEQFWTVTRVLSGAVWVCGLLIVLNFWGIAVAGIWTLLVSAGTVIGVASSHSGRSSVTSPPAYF